MQMINSVLFRSLFFAFILTPVSLVYANPKSSIKESLCGPLLHARQQTLAELTEAAQEEQQKRRQEIPFRTFLDPLVDMERVEDGVSGPLALQRLHPPHVKFQELQATSAETPAVIKLDEPGPSLALRVITAFNGAHIRTTVYPTLPKPIRSTNPPKGIKKSRSSFARPYLIGEEYRSTGVIVHLHGGGTPTAEGANAKSIGEAPAVYERGIPVLGVTMPGHGAAEIYPFTSGRQKLEYLFALIRDQVHPDVPVIITGHSWGGQFAIQAYLMWPHLAKYGVNVVGFLSMAPPADLSLGGTSVDRIAAEKKVEACMDEWKDRVAPSDYEFINNVVRAGKTAPVASMYCTLSQLDYEWRLPDDSVKRPRLMVVVGEGDGLVYTGREKIFDSFVKELVGPENYIVMKPGRTFKGSGVITGHNIFDRYMDKEDRLAMADFLGDEVNKESLYEVYARIAHFVTQQVGQVLPKNRPDKGMNDAEDALDRIYRYWSNNLAFRKFVEGFTHRTFNRLKAHEDLLNRKIELEKFNTEVTRLEAQARKDIDDEVRRTVENLGAQLSIRSVSMARKELPVQVTPERRKDLAQFIAQAEPIRQRVMNEFPDTSAEEILSLPSRPSHISSLEEAQALLNSKTIKDTKQIKQLTSFVLEARGIINRRQKELGGRIGDAIKLEVRLPDGVVTISDAQWELGLDTSTERKAQLMTYLKRVDELEGQKSAMIQLRNQELTAKLTLPEGLSSVEAVRNELDRTKALFDGRYVPPGANEQKVRHILSRLDELKELIQQTNGELNMKREGVARDLERLVREKRSATAQMQELLAGAPLIEPLGRMIEAREKALDAYTKANQEYDQFVAQRLTTLKDNNQLNEDAVKALWYEVGPFARRYRDLRELFLKESRRVEEATIEMALAGGFGTPIRNLAVKLYGEDGRSGLESEIKRHLESRERVRKSLAEFRAEAYALEKKYHELVPGYFEPLEQSLRDLLDRPYEQVVAMTRDPKMGWFILETLKKAIFEFDDLYAARDMLEKKGVDLN